MKTLATYNIKGGVGKTASAVNLAYIASKNRLRVLLWDLDPQGAASFYFRIRPEIKGGGRKLVHKKKTINHAIKATNYDSLDLLPSDFSFRDMDLYLDREKKSDRRFVKLLDQVREEYDLVIFDCPPSISLVSENVFHAADALLIPTIPTHLSFRAYEQLKKFILDQDSIRVSLFPYLYMVDRRKKIHRDFAGKFLQLFPEGLKTQIASSSTVEKMGIYCAPVPVFDSSSEVAMAFSQLWNEIWQRIY
ncbi:MAG TPA: AAA family ATPase [Gammaproteobacteria bacterium]|nr:AAA family ATPase [Gammaproteobacteria bacterium]